MNEMEKRILLDTVVSKLNYIGLAINMIGPAILLAAGMFIKKGLSSDINIGTETLETMKWVLGGVSVIEVGVAFFLKKKLFGKLFKNSAEQSDVKAQLSMAIKIMLVIHIISATPVIYGLIYHILGGTIDGFLLMIIINLIGYQLCRARKSDYEGLRIMLLGWD